MKRLSLREWMPIFPWPVWPLAGHARLGQHVVAGSMLVLRVALGNVPRGVWLDPRLYHKDTSPRLSGELPRGQKVSGSEYKFRQDFLRQSFEELFNDTVDLEGPAGKEIIRNEMIGVW